MQIKSKIDETKFCFSTKHLSKRSSLEVKYTVDKPAESFPPKVRKIFAQSLEIDKDVSVFLNKKVSPQNVPLHS